MKTPTPYTFTAPLRRYPSERATWYMVSLPRTIAAELYETYQTRHGGFGSLPVVVTIGSTTFDTSIFRDARAKSYILFIKAAVRKREGLQAGDEVSIQFVVRA